jgi:predicted metalloprotease with PDZ domain
VFANTLSGTFSVLDTLHANWNGPSIFMYVVDHKPDPVTLRIAPPAAWHVINGWSRTLDQLEFSFPNYDVLADTPTEVAPAFSVDSFRVDGILYRVVVHHNGPERGQRQRFVSDVEKIVRSQNRVIAPPPIERYTFLFNIGFPGGDGMEHLNSTQIINAQPWTQDAVVLPGISTASHEYFHTWHVKRIRPVALGPFDYTTEQYQPSLWIAEGWTNYYGNITLARTGIIDRPRYYGMLANVARYNNEMPGRKELSPRMASFHAPYWDGRAAPMATNGANTWVSYYTVGEGRAAFLDLHIRGLTRGAKSLDDVLRLLKTRTWDAPSSSYYLQGRGYTEADVERAASDVAGVDLKPWFDRYVGGTDDLPWQEALSVVGLRLAVTRGESGAAYAIDESPTATVEQRRLRDAWLTGM